MLAKLHRAGELTPTWIPNVAHEAMRDLVRARATALRALSKVRQHLQGFSAASRPDLPRGSRLDPGISTLALLTPHHLTSESLRRE